MKYQKFKAQFCVPTKDLKKWEWVDLTVNSTIPEDGMLYGNPEFKVTLPDHMFKELADTEPEFKTSYDVNNRKVSGCFADREITYKFKKTQTAKLISTLQDYFHELTSKINEKHSIENATLKKMIFIKFEHARNHWGNNLNGAYKGEVIKQLFNYFVGYEVMTHSFSGLLDKAGEPKKRYISKIGYASPEASIQHHNSHFKERDDLFLQLPNHNQSIESFEDEFSIVEWTEEREAFCQQIKDTFQRVNEDLSEFLKDLDGNKIEALIASGGFKFLTE